MNCNGIGFENGLRVLCSPHCDYRNPSDASDEARIIREEDEWAAMDTLGWLVVYKWPEIPRQWIGLPIVESWQSYLMHLLKPVCKHYGVDDEAVLKMFLRHYMPSILLSLKHQTKEEPTNG